MTTQAFRFTLFLLICLSIPVTATAQIVNIPDANLRAAIEQALGKASGAAITTADMATLTRLGSSGVSIGSNISDLTGLEHATNLTSLGLRGGSRISNLSPLSGLINLTDIDLASNSISNLSPLSGLTNLTGLTLGGNSISNLSPLSGLTQLRALLLDGNSISNLSPLSGLANLGTLTLGGNSISNLSPLSGLTQLGVLLLDGNRISDLSPLVSNTGLGQGDTVHVRQNPLTTVSLNAHIPTLQRRGVNVQFDAPAPVNIPDPNLRAAIEQALGKASGAAITTADMATLTRLGSSGVSIGSNISDLTGLEHATNLTSLGLRGGSRISNLSPLSGLINLTDIDLASNSISNLSPLSGLTNLTGLTLGGNSISNLSPLSGLTQLRALLLDGNSISNLSPLSGLTQLRALLLDGNSISNLSPLSALSGLTQLGVLTLGGNRISDLSPLVSNTGLGQGDTVHVRQNPLTTVSLNAHIPTLQRRGVNVQFDAPAPVNIPDANLRAAIEKALGKASGAAITTADMARLTRLVASNANISDLTGLEQATNLTSLSLSSNTVSDISAVSGLTNLRVLSLSSNTVSDISAVSGLTNLTNLSLYRNTVSDISAVSGLTNLTYLSLSSNSISDISAVAGLTNLTRLYLVRNSISDISAVAGLTNLTRLSLVRNSISDISAVSGLTNLTTLSLSSNTVSDISAASGLTNLTYLSLSSNSISDISAVSGLTNLTYLSLSSNSISDISAVAGLTNLTRLSLVRNSISDISAVSGLTNLTTLSLYRNTVSDISAVSGLTNLTNLSLSSNSISDISPLVSNTGLGTGDEVDVRRNALNTVSINTHIPTLQRRGVTVRFDAVVVPTVNKPDLVVQSPRVSKGTVSPGESFTLSATVRNSGSGGAAGTTLRYYRSTNRTISGSDTPVGTDAVGSLNANSNSPESITLNALTTPGTYYYGACVGTVSNETDTTNNCSTAVTVTVRNPADVNRDGVVDLQDIAGIVTNWEQRGQNNADVDGNGIVDVEDIVLVLAAIEATAAAPAFHAQGLNLFTVEQVQQWLIEAKALADKSPAHQRGILRLEQLLAILTPQETALLANYPNPFNPETWIPYRLAAPAEVTLRIYAANGQVVRTLAFGHQAAGFYEGRHRAAYWDGRNAQGEPVASGVYFYHLSAGDYSATRRMLILK